MMAAEQHARDGRASTVVDEWKRNWTIVLAAALGIGLTGTPGYTMGVFIAPLEAEFGWNRATIASALMFPAVVAFFLGPLIGAVVDRIGPRRVGILGTFLMSLGFLALSRIGSALWMWWAAWLYIALAAVLVKHMVWTAAVASVFSQGRGLALAVALCGTSIGSAIAPVLSGYLIETFDWRIAYVGLAAFFGVLILPVMVLFFSSAPDRRRIALARGRRPDGSLPADAGEGPVLVGMGAMEGILSWRFLRLSLAAITMVLVVTNLMINMVPIVTSVGHSRLVAVGVAGMAGLAGVAGRLVAGVLLDRMNGNVVAAVSSLIPAIACALFLLLPHSYPAIVVAALLVGMALGSEYDAVAYLVSRHFGTRCFGTLFGLLGGLLAAAAGAGPTAFNYIYDVYGTYAPAITAMIPLCFVASALFLSLGPYPDFEAGQDAGPTTS
jgi:MFS family permease